MGTATSRLMNAWRNTTTVKLIRLGVLERGQPASFQSKLAKKLGSQSAIFQNLESGDISKAANLTYSKDSSIKNNLMCYLTTEFGGEILWLMICCG